MTRIPDLDALCEAAREAEEPTNDDRRAVFESIAAHTGLALGAAITLAAEKATAGSLTAAGTTGTATLAPASAVVKGASLFKGLAWLAGIGATGALTVHAVQVDEPTSAPKAPTAVLSMASAAGPPGARGVEVEALPERGAEETPVEKQPDAVVAVARPRLKQARTLEEEAAALADIQRALRDGEPEKALLLLDTEERSSQRGILAPERTAARVFALCSAGRAAEARALAQRFLAKHADSPLADRIREGCREEPLAR